MNSLKNLGFRPKPKTPTQQYFDARRRQDAVKPDVDWQPEAEREPQAPKFTQMWLEHFNNMGNIHNPVGSPLE